MKIFDISPHLLIMLIDSMVHESTLGPWCVVQAGLEVVVSVLSTVVFEQVGLQLCTTKASVLKSSSTVKAYLRWQNGTST